MQLSDRIQSIEESRTVRFTSLIQRLSQEGKEIINFAVGEPDGETPPSVIASTKDALDAQKTKYGPVAGLPELKARLALQFDGYDENHIILSNGSKQALYSIFQIICNPSDEVIIPRPYWVSFSQQVKLAGANPVFVDTINHQLDCHGIEKAITERTKAIVINTPNNPTGAVYPRNNLEKIASLAGKHDLFLISDEAYDSFVYDGFENISLFAFEDIREKVIIIRSFSKSYSMTGFRIGYVAASEAVIKELSKIQSHLTGNVCTFAQHGALAALEIDESTLSQRRSELQKKRDIAYDYTSRLFKCIKPHGAFYLFPDISDHLKKGEKTEDFAARLLNRSGVAVVPGEAFGMSKHVRISYALPDDIILKGFDRIAGVI
jgi:aspartate aminotransferase